MDTKDILTKKVGERHIDALIPSLGIPRIEEQFALGLYEGLLNAFVFLLDLQEQIGKSSSHRELQRECSHLVVSETTGTALRILRHLEDAAADSRPTQEQKVVVKLI